MRKPLKSNAMKCLRTCLFLLAIASISYSQVPHAFNYQAILRNTDGTIKTNETVVLQISIIHGHTDGPPVYLEIHNTTTSELGMVHLVIGAGETSDDLSTIDWANGPYYLEISVDDIYMGTSPLLSVPYALYAASGNQGPQGSPGEKGPQGESGPPGPPGEPDAELLERIRLLESMNGIGTMIDIEGNEYTTVKIGDQVWMAENLRVTRYADGSAIPLVEDSVSWRSLAITDRAYSWVGNGDSLAEIYGNLYTWAAAMDGVLGNDDNPGNIQGVCPDDWHLPSDAEWKELEMFLGMSQGEADYSGKERGEGFGSKLKEAGSQRWPAPNYGASNEYGFTALPAGYRYTTGDFGFIGTGANFWTATEGHLESTTWYRYLISEDYFLRSASDRKEGKSVRCVRGAGSSQPPVVITSSLGQITTTSAELSGEVTSDGGLQATERGVCWSTSALPTTSDNRTLDGSGEGKFTSTLSNLSPGTLYHARAYVTTVMTSTYGEVYSFRTRTGTISDYDGNTYWTIQIGSQNWMAENLKVAHFPDGNPIPLLESDEEWNGMGNWGQAYCWYGNDTSNIDVFGALYSWAAATNLTPLSDPEPGNIQGVCPDGWHLPSDDEWKELEIYLGMSQEQADSTFTRGTDEGGKLKASGTMLWESPNTEANDESGFHALPGGYRLNGYIYLGNTSIFWTSTERDETRAWYRSLYTHNGGIRRGTENRISGLSVRCLEE